MIQLSVNNRNMKVVTFWVEINNILEINGRKFKGGGNCDLFHAEEQSDITMHSC